MFKFVIKRKSYKKDVYTEFGSDELKIGFRQICSINFVLTQKFTNSQVVHQTIKRTFLLVILPVVNNDVRTMYAQLSCPSNLVQSPLSLVVMIKLKTEYFKKSFKYTYA